MVRHLRRVAVAVVGGIVLAVGVAMLVLPGPAVVVIPAGLAILATEFQWARRLLHRVRTRVEGGLDLLRRRRSPTPPSPPGGSNEPPDGTSTLRAC
jgi:tellurite resistance protein TerC